MDYLSYNPRQIGIVGALHNMRTMVKALSKHFGLGQAIRAEVPTLLVDLIWVVSQAFANIMAVGESTKVISWTFQEKRGPW